MAIRSGVPSKVDPYYVLDPYNPKDDPYWEGKKDIPERGGGGGESPPEEPKPKPEPKPPEAAPAPKPEPEPKQTKTPTTTGPAVEPPQLKPEQRAFKTEPDWVIQERNAAGEPSVYKDKAGVRHYAPGSTMYKIGWRSDDPKDPFAYNGGLGRREETETGVKFTSEAPYVTVITASGEYKQLTRKEAEKLARTSDDDRIDTLNQLVKEPTQDMHLVLNRNLQRKINKGKDLDLVKFVKAGIIDLTAYNLAGYKVTSRDIARAQEIIKAQGKISELNKKADSGIYDPATETTATGGIPKKYTELPDGVYIEDKTLADIKKVNKEQYNILTQSGYMAYSDALSNAMLALVDYREKDGDYRVSDALLKRDKALTSAVKLLFPEDVVTNIKTKHMAGLTMGTGFKPLNLSNVQVPTGEIPATSAKVTAGIPVMSQDILSYVPKPLLAAAGVAALSPIPGDEAIAIVIIGASLSGIAAVNFIKKFKRDNKRLPSTNDIIIVQHTSEGTAKATFIDPKTLLPLGGLKPLVPPKKPEGSTELKAPKVTEVGKGTKIVPPIIKTGITGFPKVDMGKDQFIILDPQKTLTDIDMARIITAQAQVSAAETQMRTNAPKPVTTIPINYNKILEDTIKAKTAADTAKAFKVLNEAIKKYSSSFDPDIAGSYRRAYQEYLRKKAMLDAARKQYIASLNPDPIKGKISDEAIAPIVQAHIEKSAGISPGKLASIISEATGSATKTFTKALTEGKTEAQAKTEAQTKTQAQVKSDVKQATDVLTDTQTNTLAKALAKAITQPLTRTATTTPPAAAATTAAIAAATATVPTTPGMPPASFMLPGGKLSDKDKRKLINDSSGAIAWRQGELKGKDIWQVGVYPYEHDENWTTVTGRKPQNATIVKGPKSAYQTIRLLYGKSPAKKVTGDMGIIDFYIEPKTSRKIGIGFSPDPKQETTGDITIGRGKPSITESRPRISGRSGIRITPKKPRLRR